MTGPVPQPLPRRERVSDAAWFADERGIDRRLKVSWHPDRGLLVLSLWQGDTCTATFRMGMADVPRLVGMLVDSLGQAAAQTASQVTASRPGQAAAEARQRLAESWTRWKRDRSS